MVTISLDPISFGERKMSFRGAGKVGGFFTMTSAFSYSSLTKDRTPILHRLSLCKRKINWDIPCVSSCFELTCESSVFHFQVDASVDEHPSCKQGYDGRNRAILSLR